MELCAGTLGAYLASLQSSAAHLPAVELVEIMTHILSGLRHYHDLHFCHRDIKMGNSMPSFYFAYHQFYIQKGLMDAILPTLRDGCWPTSASRVWWRVEGLVIENSDAERKGIVRPNPSTSSMTIITSQLGSHFPSSPISGPSAVFCLSRPRLAERPLFVRENMTFWYARGEGTIVTKLDKTQKPLLDLETLSHINTQIKICLNPSPQKRPSAASLLVGFEEMKISWSVTWNKTYKRRPQASIWAGNVFTASSSIS